VLSALLIRAAVVGAFLTLSGAAYYHKSAIYLSAIEVKRIALDRIPCPEQTDRTMVALVFGQSNAGNSGAYLHRAGPNVIDFYNGHCFPAQDPLLGSDGVHGSVWGLMADAIAARYDHIILIPAAVGSVTVREWNTSLAERLRTRAMQRYRVTHFLWHQGESDWHGDAGAYKRELGKLIQTTKGYAPGSDFYVSIASVCNTPPDPLLQSAQRSVLDANNRIFPGPNTDTLAPEGRKDGCHFSRYGQEVVAEMWARSIQATH
jgi:hypothetical protein